MRRARAHTQTPKPPEIPEKCDIAASGNKKKPSLPQFCHFCALPRAIIDNSRREAHVPKNGGRACAVRARRAFVIRSHSCELLWWPTVVVLKAIAISINTIFLREKCDVRAGPNNCADKKSPERRAQNVEHGQPTVNIPDVADP